MKKESSGDDSNLVEACINRDLTAWAKLIEKYSVLIYISIDNRLKRYGFTLPRQDIEDIRQNVLTSLWQEEKLRNIKNRRNISYWLAICCGNAAIEHIRKMRLIEPVRPVSIFDRVAVDKELAETVTSAGPTPLDELAKEEISKKIDQAIEALPVKEKLIIKLNILYGKQYGDIAGMLNLPKGTVSSYIRRAREKLINSLKSMA